MKQQHALVLGVITAAGITALAASSLAEGPPRKPPPTASKQFITAMQTLADARPAITKRANDLLAQRYDLSGKVDPTVRMSGGKKPVPVGPTARLKGVSWDQLATLPPAQIKKRGVFPYLPLPHPLEPAGGGPLFPPSQLTTHPEFERVDVAFDIPDAYLPEFPPPMFLTTHPELGDVSKGQEITLDNYYPLLGGLLAPLQLDGLRLLVTTFPSQQFNQTEDRATWEASNGVSCFSCHINGHTTGQFHRAPDLRPAQDRVRLETPTLRGMFAQRTFGSKRNIRTLEDFSEVEANTAYFDGDDSLAQKKGARHFSREEVAALSAFQNIIDLPPAPKLLPTGDLDLAQATPPSSAGRRYPGARHGVRPVIPVRTSPITCRTICAWSASMTVGRRGSSRHSLSGASRTRRPTCTMAGCSRWKIRWSSSTWSSAPSSPPPRSAISSRTSVCYDEARGRVR